jgi:hypothetical protein
LRLSIAFSKVTVVVDVLAGQLDVPALRNSVEFAVRRRVDAIGFANAAGFDVDLYSVMEDEHAPTILGVRVDELQAEAKAGPVQPDELYRRALASPELTAALADLREAIRQPLATGFYCYRAIETLRRPFEQEGASTAENWQRFRGALRLDEEGLKALANHSKRERHGEQLPVITSEFRVKAMRYARTVVERFVAYLQTGQPIGRDVPILEWPSEN